MNLDQKMSNNLKIYEDTQEKGGDDENQLILLGCP